MHIGVFSYYYLPVVNGVTITIADWKRLGEKAGAQFVVCVPRTGKEAHADRDVFAYPAVSLYKRLGITVPTFPEAQLEKELGRRRVDVLHAHHPFYIGNLALYFKKKLAIPLVFTYHTRYTDYFTSYLPWLSGNFFADIVTRIVVRFMNQCDAVTVANETLKQELLTKGVHTPIFIVPPGIDTKTFARGNRDAARGRLRIRKRDTVLLYVGRLAKEKNIYFLIRSFARIHRSAPSVKLLLVGHGLEETRLRKYAQKRGLANNIVFATQETVRTIPDVYAAADMFIYASQTETYGRVIVEAMAAGLPIVALAGPSIVDLLKDGITGRVVFQKSPRAFAAAALALIRDPDKRRFLATHAKKEAQTKYDSMVSWHLLSEVYQSLPR